MANAQNSLQEVKWCRPPNGVLKLNCDASFRAEESSGSWGFIIRDHDGDVVMTGRGRLNFVLSAFQAELIACMQGVKQH
jgi:ribonuclease HI